MQSPDQVLTAREMRAAERVLIDRGVSVDALMQRAGRSAADWVWRLAGGHPVTVLCGPGNNGGDGYVIAEALRERGCSVDVVAPLPPATHAARAARAAWRGAVTPVFDGTRGAVFVDCLFGSGLQRPLDPEHETLIAELSGAHETTVAIDLPSGTSTDDGALLGRVLRCHVTLALGAWKPAHFLMPALAMMGDLRLLDIGIGPVPGAPRVFPRPRLSAPPIDAHKYSRGLLGIIAGAMPGAAILAATAAARAGAGYVKVLGNMAGPLPASLVVDGRRLPEALADQRWSALLVGPGLGRSEDAAEKLASALDRPLPLVLDADALHLLDDDLLEGFDVSRVLVTPHEGELAALCRTFGIAGGDKPARVSALAERTGLTVLAKGPDTVLAAADGRLAYFHKAPSWLAAAGTGDVLAGIAASRFAAGRNPFDAAGEAMWLHAETARIAGPALTADDLARCVSKAYARFL